MGKPAGSDLLQGTLTLPFFYFLQSHPTATQLVAQLEDAQQQLEDGEHSAWNGLVKQIVTEIVNSPAIELARHEARDFIVRAQGNLSAFPDTPYKQSMLGLCEFVIQRTY